MRCAACGTAKGFAVIAILCLGFGIGLNTTIFSIVDGVLLKPFPYDDPDRIVVPAAHNRPLDISEAGISYLDYRDLKSRRDVVRGRSPASQGRSLTISDGGEPERFQGGARCRGTCFRCWASRRSSVSGFTERTISRAAAASC